MGILNLFLTFFIHMLFILARGARAITNCTPIASHDQMEVFFIINHCRNLKIDEFVICGTFVENRFFRKILTFFSKKLIF